MRAFFKWRTLPAGHGNHVHAGAIPSKGIFPLSWVRIRRKYAFAKRRATAK
jgi:hypothetical protein